MNENGPQSLSCAMTYGVRSKKGPAACDHDIVRMHVLDGRGGPVDHARYRPRRSACPKELRGEVEAEVRLVPDLPVPDTRQVLIASAVAAGRGKREAARAPRVGDAQGRPRRRSSPTRAGLRCSRADEPGPEARRRLAGRSPPTVARVCRVGGSNPPGAGRCHRAQRSDTRTTRAPVFRISRERGVVAGFGRTGASR